MSTINEEKKKKGDRCVRIAKRKYDVWPSAYASGAVVKCRQGKIWKGLKEEELNEIIDEELDEAAYEGNMGAMEVFKFLEEASPEEVAKFDELLKQNREQEAWDLVKKFTGVELVDIGTPGSSGSLEEKKKKKPDFKKEKESGLHGWFSRQGGKGKSKGWVDCNTCRTDKKTGRKTCKTCGRKEGEKRSKYPACRPKPSDCGSSGKGKDWGKKSQKESLQDGNKLLDLVKEALREIASEN